MPACSSFDLINEIYIGILSMENSFTSDALAKTVNANRKKKNEKRKVSTATVDRVLTKLWFPLEISKTENGFWRKGTSPMRGMIKFRSEIVERIIEDAKIEATSFDIGKWIALGEEATTRKAYICYPYRDNPIKRSMELLVLLIHLYPKVKDVFVPAIPHEMYWGLEERVDRKTAMDKCAELITRCDFLLYCLKTGDEPSSGMKQDMEIAKANGKETKCIENILGDYPDTSEIMKKCGLSEFTDSPNILTVNST